ncbi:hypothetical protein [Synechococcus sp. RS9916]|uniref:hypothetical protein n=1 Tax=Synechococcus sp. RS9916 TaxID=221359 RepID=UPI0000E53579|nr:hypothetical protein [Synechococcus sp. RS9916]EAU75530.1 hypothetical protein RS9916_38522 [Synechococcus sp. RS9916]
MSGALGVVRPRLGLVLVVLVCSVFALRALLLIDATGLWSDELYTVGKSFQPSYAALLAMLRLDTHPPLYYSLVWIWGRVLPASAVTLRLFSWLAYLAGGLLITAQAGALARRWSGAKPRLAVAAAALMAFCSPYPVRFAIEGKGYALLVLLVALAWWWRQRHQWLGYGISVVLAALTHYYGLFLFAAAAVWDGWRGRRRASLVASVGLVPALLWMVQASAYLMRNGTGAWIGRPDFALLEDTLARALGLWPLPKLALLLLVAVVVARAGLQASPPDQNPRSESPGLADRSGLTPSLLMVGGVVAMSFWKPMAFSRYFVVLLPALIPWLAVRLSALPLTQRGRGVVALAAAALVLSWWWHSFCELDPAVNGHGAREADQFQLVSRALAAEPHRFSRRERLFNLSDRMEVAAGRMAQPEVPWGGASELDQLLVSSALPDELWLADSGDVEGTRRRLKALRRRAEGASYRCQKAEIAGSGSAPYAQVQQCQLEVPLHSEHR